MQRDAELVAALRKQLEDSVVVQFYAGRCNYDPDTKLVHSKATRGKITIKKNLRDPSMYDFEWSERNSAAVQFSRSIIPTMAQWKKSEDCKDGRVYILKISGGTPVFFWMQEVKAEKDEEILEKLKDVFSGDGADPPQQNIQNNEGMQAFMDLFGQGMGNSGNSGSQNNAAQQLVQQQMQQMQAMMETDPDLQDLFPSERIADLVEIICAEPENFEALVQHLPEELRSREDLAEHLQSPEFRAACSRLNAVFRSGESGPLYSELGLASSGVGVQAFLAAINDKFGPNEDDDEDMGEN